MRDLPIRAKRFLLLPLPFAGLLDFSGTAVAAKLRSVNELRPLAVRRQGTVGLFRD